MQLMKWGLKPRSRKLIACMVALIMLLSMMGLGIPGTAQAKTDTSAPAESLVVNILNPDGSTTLVHDYTYAELEPLEEVEYYATIDAMPAAVGTKAKGVKINALINDAKQYNSNIKWESGQRLLFYVTDSPYTYQPAFYTYDNLYVENRYYYPELVETYNSENPTAVSLDNAVSVEPMLASSSYQARWAKDAELKSTDNPVTMDGNDSFRFCMGITEAEATTPDVSTTNKFARWVYRVDVAPLNSPKLKADKTDNAIGQLIEITFADNAAWRGAISSVKVNDSALIGDQYSVAEGKLTINSGVFTQAGDYTITVEANGFMNSTVKQTINGPPAYTVTFTVTDGTNPIQGANITIAEQTLTTDADGKATIDLEDGAYTYSVTAAGFIAINDGSVTVSGAALAEAVTMTVNPGGLTDAEKVAVAKANLTLGDISAVTADLTLPGTQNEATVTWTSGNIDVITNDGKVTRPAAGQPDVNVTLTATITAGEASDTKDFIVTVKAEEAPGSKSPPALAADTTDNKVGQAVDITFTNDETWLGAITGITVDGNALTSGQYAVTAGNINLIANIFTAPGDYEIVVQATDYVDACVTQKILGVSRPGAWDGSIDTSWYNAAGKGFEISTPAELAGLAAIVNGTADGIAQDLFEGKTVILMADIDLGGIQNKDGTWDPASIQWTSIGGGEAGDSNNASFRGIFDGNGHIVSNIYIEVQNLDWQNDYEARNRGLFGLIWVSGVVKNIGVTGYVAGARSIAGVVGKNWGRIENCFNAATVIGTQSKGVGGITGANWNSPSIVNCYNIGSILTKYGTGLAGGIAGDNEHIVSNCYNAGQISGTESTNIGGIVGNIKGNNNPIVTDCYYDSALNTKGIGHIDSNNIGSYTIENVEGKTAEEMTTPAFVALLNGENGTAFVQDTNNINNGYPILAWQVAAPPARKAAPVLTPDTINNNLGQSIDITFTDDADWRGVISRIIINDTALTGDQYTVSAGNIKIAASVFTAAGDYTITVPAANYHDVSVTQTIESGTLSAPPALTADSMENIWGQAVDITFTDDEAWRGAVYAVTVNNTALTGDQYTLTAGNINIAAAVFTAAGDYEIVIQASGYSGAAVTQNIQGKTPPVLTADSKKIKVGQAVVITFTDDVAWRSAISGITVNDTALTGDQYTLTTGKINIVAAVFTAPGDYEIVVQAGSYVDASVIQNKIPVLIPDVTDNNIGNPIEITFTDDEPWRTVITDISVDGNDLAADKYTIVPGKITIAADVFTENRNYILAFRANGYYDAVVLQSIIVPQTMLPGNIYTIAGTGTAGYSGDGGAAVCAQLYKPNAATVDSHGNIYITDAYNHAIRKIDSNGIITTVAGNGTRRNSWESFCEGVPATEANLSIPGNVAFDSAGNLYIADQRAVRKVDANGIITTVTTTSGDCKIAFDNEDNLYIVNRSAHKICKMNPSGTITTVAGNGTEGYSGDGGSATEAQLNNPSAVTLDSIGNIYISDRTNNCIRKVDTKGIITTIAGTGTKGYSGDGGPAIEAQFNLPSNVEVDSIGNLYIADYFNHRVRKVATNGIITTIVGTGTEGYSGDGAPAIKAQLNRPINVSLDSAGNLYITECNNHCIRFVKAFPAPPALTADSTDNKVGNPIDITFTDDETWRNAITEIKVGDTVLDSSQCTKEAGKITIAAGVFTETKDYTITIKATGYQEATVTQTIEDVSAEIVFTIDGDAVTTATYTMAQLQLMTATERDYPSKSGTVKCKGVALKDLLTQLSITNGSLIAQINITDADSFTVDPVTVADLLNTDKAYLLTYLMDGAPVTGGETALRIYRAADSPKAATIKNVCGITISNPPAPGNAPALTADSRDNKVGNPIDITFTDNEAWRNAITEVKVGETVLESSKYTKEAGKITIAAGVFTEAGNYTIVIKATGYEDASVTQIINKDYVTTALSIKVDNGNPVTVTAEQINALNSNNVIRYFSHYKDGQMNYFTGLGAPLAAILSQYASLNSTNISNMTVRGADGYYVTFADPQNELFNERYYYPAEGDRVKVDTIIATKASENLVSDINQLDNVFTMRLIMGQTSSEERTISRMVKWVSEIDITTTAAINVPVTGVSLNKTATTLVVNNSEQLTAAITPANATDQTVTWTSDNEEVVTVDNTGKVTAVGTGQAVITATTKDGSFTASCTVTVATKPLYKLTPVEDDVYTIGTSDGRSTMTVNAGQSGFKSFAVSVEPDISHKGNETVIFTHWRGGTELQLNATVADFDVANTAQAGFNVQAGDVIKAYIVDRLTNDSNINPVVFQ